MIIEKGAVVVKDGLIRDIGPASSMCKKYSARKTIDAGSGLIMPGLINTHAHSAMTLLRGIADDMPLSQWLQDYIFPLEDRFVDADFSYWGSMLACAEMIRSGTTTFCDMYFFEKECGRAAEKTGIHAVIGEGIVASGKSERRNWNRKKTLTLELIDAFKDSGLITVAVEPHSPYACSQEVLIKAKEFARKHGLLYIIHLAETKEEYATIMREKKLSPVAYLESLGVLDERTLAAHCVWLDGKDIDILKKRGVKISHCPQSNMKLGSGIAPAAKLLGKSIAVSLGTDGAASNNTLDMLLEMKCAALLAKVDAHDPRLLSAREMVRMATMGGAIALGMEKVVGSLEIGKRADLITINIDSPHLTPCYDPYSQVVYCANGADVRDSVIDGKVVMENRVLLTANMNEITKKAQSIAAKIRAS
jgi:5-methylthioadenosine/S-adenosylhomocysteine deaminase